jgi:hypothetical protein
MCKAAVLADMTFTHHEKLAHLSFFEVRGVAELCLRVCKSACTAFFAASILIMWAQLCLEKDIRVNGGI